MQLRTRAGRYASWRWRAHGDGQVTRSLDGFAVVTLPFAKSMLRWDVDHLCVDECGFDNKLNVRSFGKPFQNSVVRARRGRCRAPPRAFIHSHAVK